MSNFVNDRFLVIGNFSTKVDFNKPAEKSIRIKGVLGASFEVRSVEEKTQRMVLQDKENDFFLIIHNNDFAISVSSIDDGEQDAKRFVLAKQSITNLMNSQEMPKEYESLVISASGLYLPDESRDELQSNKAVSSLLHRLINREVDDVLNFSLNLRSKASYGSKTTEFRVVQNTKSKLYALNIDVTSYIIKADQNFDQTEAIKYLNEIDIRAELLNERAAIDRIS